MILPLRRVTGCRRISFGIHFAKLNVSSKESVPMRAKDSLLITAFALIAISCNNRHIPLESLKNDGGVGANKLSPPPEIKALFDRCSSCHNGSSAPGNWSNYDNILAKKDIIYNRVVEKKGAPMPPMAGMLSDAERNMIGDWIVAGAPAISNPVASEPVAAPAPVPLEPQVQCVGCHGEKGISFEPNYPNLAGQNPEYLTTQILNFAENKRIDNTTAAKDMNDTAKKLPEVDMAAVVDYFSNIVTPPQEKKFTDVELALIQKGKELVQGCTACHTEKGSPQAPTLYGQKTEYLMNQMKAFKSGSRTNPIMTGIIAGVKEDDFAAIAIYFYSLQTPAQLTANEQ